MQLNYSITTDIMNKYFHKLCTCFVVGCSIGTSAYLFIEAGYITYLASCVVLGYVVAKAGEDLKK